MAANGGYCKEVNIKADLPTADLAVKRVGYNIQNGKIWGCSAIKIIHGYGSSGIGGKIRVAVRQELAAMKAAGKIRDYVIGEEFSIFSPATRSMLVACREMRADRDLERHNNGITVVWL